MSKNIDISGTGLAQNIRRLRSKRHQSQKDVAAATKLTVRTISDIEKGHRKRIFEDTLLRLAKHFDTTVEKLLEKPPWRNYRTIIYTTVTALALVVAITSYSCSSHGDWIEVNGPLLSAKGWERPFPCDIHKAAPFNWDGHDIIAVALACTSEESASFQILDAHNGETIFSLYPDYKKLDSIFDPSLFETGNFLSESFEFANLYGDDTRQLVILFRHTLWYPSYMLTLDSDFEVIGSYYHPGHLNDIKVCDIDRDSKDELLVTASSNLRGHEGGALLIFDGEHLSGAAVDSISGGDHVLHGDLKDGSLRRILIPSMPDELLTLAGSSRVDGNHCSYVCNRKGEAEITISLRIGDKSILLKVDPQLEPVARPIPTDPFRMINQEWLAKGLISRDYLSPEYLDDWTSRILRFEEGRLKPIP